MAKYEKTLESLGLTFDTISHGLRDSIKKFKNAEKEFADMQEEFSTIEQSDENYETLKGELEDYKNSLAEADDTLVHKIKKYHEKKDFYDAKLQHMRDKAAGKQTESPKSVAFQKAAPAAQPAPQPEPQPEPVYVAATGAATAAAAPLKAEPITVKAEEVKEEKKKGDNWLLWGILALIGIGVGVNVMRNRE